MNCKHLALAIDLLKENGWEVVEEVTGWSEMHLVIYFKPRLTEKMREELKKITELEYYYFADPHYGKDERFICEKCKIGISFLFS